MLPARRVDVQLAGDRGYSIHIGCDLLADAPELFRQWLGETHLLLVTDVNVDPLVADPLGDRLVDAGLEVDILVVDAGESSKSPEMAQELWEGMLEAGADRHSAVVAVGGGVVGDLAGFAAATFGRGLRLVQLPTTLLAQVDSSVGGKVGINLVGAKNMVGAFWQPRGVLADVGLLRTLPPRELSAGLAEVVKYGVILDEPLIAWLESHADAILAGDPVSLLEIVERSCRWKAHVVERDEREESGLRAILNYGHTFGHAIEAATNYERLLHGEAVAMGMMCAARLAHDLGRISTADVDRQAALLERLGLPVEVPADLDPAELLSLMWHDKKVSQNQLNFILPTRLGEVETVSGLSEKSILAAIRGGLKQG